MIKKFEEYNLINEGLISDFLKSKIKKVIFSHIDKLNSQEYLQLKKEIKPFEGLSRKEIEEKIRMKLSLNESVDKKVIDPYGEEVWDDEKDTKRNKKLRILKNLFYIFGTIGLVSLFAFPFLLLAGFIVEDFVENKTVHTIMLNVTISDIIILLASWILFYVFAKIHQEKERL